MGNYWFYYLIISIVQKLFLIILNFNSYMIPSIPYFLLGDIIVAGCIFLFLDLPYIKGNAVFKKYFFPPAFFTYAAIIFLSMFNMKLYLTIGSFLTYDLFLQVNDFNSFSAGLASETDLTAIALIFSGLAYSVITTFRLKSLKINIFQVNAAGITASVFALLIFSSTLYSRGNSREFYSIDSDPVITLAVSAIYGARGNVKSDAAPMTDDITASVLSQAGNFIPVKSGSASGMNVVLYIIESTNPSYLNEKVTPNIMNLSKKSIVLDSHYTTEPATMKAIYSIYTGRFPYVTREWDQFIALSNKDVTLPEILSQNGYHTEFITTDDGKIYYQNRFISKRVNRCFDKTDLKSKYPSFKDYGMGIDDAAMVQYFSDFLKEQQGKKFFITLFPVNPHHPYIIQSEKNNIFGKKTAFDRYRNSLNAADETLGKCYALLEKQGLAQNTLFIIVSDHGEAFYQHKRNYLHSLFLYDENVKTVSMIVNPVLFQKQYTYKSPSSHNDITPTILDLAGIKPVMNDNLKFEGSSILKRKDQRAIFFTSFSVPFVGCRDGKYKYILNQKYNTQELYDLEADPGETINLADTQSDLCKKMYSASGIVSTHNQSVKKY